MLKIIYKRKKIYIEIQKWELKLKIELAKREREKKEDCR